MINYETREIVFTGDIETINFLDNLEESLFQYYQLKGYNQELIQQIDFRSNILNSMVCLFRSCGLSPTEVVEQLTLTTSLEATGELHGKYKEQWTKTNLKMNNRISKIEQNKVES